MREFMRRWRWAFLAVALLAAGLAYAFWPEATPVDLGRVTRGPMVVGVTDDGVTRARDIYVVAAPVTGQLDRIELEVGDRVQQGAVVARVRGPPAGPLDLRSLEEARAAVVAAQAAVNQAAAVLRQSRADRARVEALAAQGYYPQAQAEAQRTRVATAAADLARAQAAEKEASAAVAAVAGRSGEQSVSVRAPASGVVLEVMAESEAVIVQGTPLLVVGDPRRIEIVVDLLSRQAVQVRPGDAVEIRAWGGDQPLAGRVARVEPFGRLKVSALGIEEQRVNVIVELEPSAAPEAARLGHGYELEATVILWRSGNCLRIPIAAIFRGARGEWHAFVLENGRLFDRELRIGHLNQDYAEVLTGVRAGEAVILNPPRSLKPGMRARPRQDSP